LILIWFTGPISKLAQLIVPVRQKETKRAGDPLYLDESSLTAPSLGIQRICLELTRLGEQVLEIVRRGSIVVVNGRIEDTRDLLDQDKESDRLTSAILHYIGRLSQVEHSEKESRQMVDLAQIASSLEGISDVVTTNLVSVTQQRLAEGIDLGRLRDENTSRFTDAVIRNLEQAVRTISQPSPGETSQVIAARAQIEALAAAARQSVLDKLQLTDKADVLGFRLATDMIEQFTQIARFSRTIARTTKDL
jgi:phosphate:Na+ symporter